MVDIREIKLYLDEFDDSDDYLINSILKSALSSIETYCNRTFKKALHNEMIVGIENFYVKNTPLLDVISVVDSDSNDVFCNFTDDRVVLKKRKKTSLSGFSYFDAPIEEELFIRYIGGYDVLPEDLKAIVIDMVKMKFLEIKEDASILKSRSEGSINKTFIDKELIKEEYKVILDNYKVFNI